MNYEMTFGHLRQMSDEHIFKTCAFYLAFPLKWNTVEKQIKLHVEHNQVIYSQFVSGLNRAQNHEKGIVSRSTAFYFYFLMPWLILIYCFSVNTESITFVLFSKNNIRAWRLWLHIAIFVQINNNNRFLTFHCAQTTQFSREV